MTGGTRPRHALAVQVTVSAVALGVFLLHVLVPAFRLDLVAVALLGIAALPWLGALVESFEVAGAKVRYRAIEQKVREVADDLQRTQRSVDTLDERLERVESFVFSGVGSAEQQEALSRALSAYRAHLAEVGVEPGPALRIHIDDDQPAVAHPDEAHGRYVLGVAFADRPDVLLHEYTHELLARLASVPRERWAPSLAGVESGLAYYLPSSALDDPVHDGRYDLRRPPRPAEFAPDPAHRAGLCWASALWELRTEHGRLPIDRCVVGAWRAVWADELPDGRTFLAALRDGGPATSEALDRVVARHGVEL